MTLLDHVLKISQETGKDWQSKTVVPAVLAEGLAQARAKIQCTFR